MMVIKDCASGELLLHVSQRLTRERGTLKEPFRKGRLLRDLTYKKFDSFLVEALAGTEEDGGAEDIVALL
jgi:hypothetical protein